MKGKLLFCKDIRTFPVKTVPFRKAFYNEKCTGFTLAVFWIGQTRDK